MTAVVQPTDTDVAFPLKCAATRCRNDLRRELAEKARLEDVQPVYRCGPYEVLRISYEACRYIEKQNEEKHDSAGFVEAEWFPCIPAQC